MNAIGRATAVSYNRPIITNTSPIGGTHDFIFGVEHSAIRWLEENGYDVSYISGVDTTRSGSLLLNHEAFLSVGHDEYWSAEQRANVENARDAGRQPRLLERQRVLLEGSLGNQHRRQRHAVPNHGLLQGDLGRNAGSDPTFRPAPGAIRASQNRDRSRKTR